MHTMRTKMSESTELWIYPEWEIFREKRAHRPPKSSRRNLWHWIRTFRRKSNLADVPIRIIHLSCKTWLVNSERPCSIMWPVLKGTFLYGSFSIDYHQSIMSPFRDATSMNSIWAPLIQFLFANCINSMLFWTASSNSSGAIPAFPSFAIEYSCQP